MTSLRYSRSVDGVESLVFSSQLSIGNETHTQHHVLVETWLLACSSFYFRRPRASQNGKVDLGAHPTKQQLSINNLHHQLPGHMKTCVR